MKRGPNSKTFEEFFERIAARIKCGDPKDCWLYQGKPSGNGHPYASFKNHHYKLSRVILERKLGRPLLPKREACHSCDNGWCLNPNHLWEGTHWQNMHDMIRKGRDRKAHGVEYPSHKLTEAQVLEIRRRYQKGVYGAGCYVLAAEFGVAYSTIRHIVTRAKWKHI